MSILTYKVKHEQDFTPELQKAILVAQYAIQNKKCRTTKDVKHINLKACIANQILKKYGNSKKIKNVNYVKLTINGFFVKVDKDNLTIHIPSLKLKFSYQFPNNFVKVNQVELDNEYVYVSCEVKDEQEIKYDNFIGVDRNTTGHCAVVSIPKTGKVIKLGKKGFHYHRKYKKIRARLQSKNAKKALKRIKHREHNIVKDLNHKISKKIVQVAKENNCGIKLENLKGIRKSQNKNSKKNKSGESFKCSINTWEFYELQQFIEYKAKICGIPVRYVDPAFTSQMCSKCGQIGTRNGKTFKCSNCGHVDHADSNAGFNIALKSALEFKVKESRTKSNGQFAADSDAAKGSTDTPKLVRKDLEVILNPA